MHIGCISIAYMRTSDSRSTTCFDYSVFDPSHMLLIQEHCTHGCTNDEKHFIFTTIQIGKICMYLSAVMSHQWLWILLLFILNYSENSFNESFTNM